MDFVYFIDSKMAFDGIRKMLAGVKMEWLVDGGQWVDVEQALLIIEIAKRSEDREEWYPLGKWATIQAMQSRVDAELNKLSWKVSDELSI